MCVDECNWQYSCILAGIYVTKCPLGTKIGGFYMYLMLPDNSMYWLIMIYSKPNVIAAIKSSQWLILSWPHIRLFADWMM